MGTPHLAVEGISKHFGGVQALKDVCCEVGVGERLAILGGNGSGKSTLLKIIGGFLAPDAGHVRLTGRDVTHLAAYRRVALGIGLTFQGPLLLEERTIAKNMAVALQPTAQGAAARRLMRWRHESSPAAARAIYGEEGGGEREAERRVRELSYGTRRQLEMTLLFARRPTLMVLDEPSAGLGAEEIKELIDQMLGVLSDETMIVVDHDMDLLRSISSHAIALDRGRVVAAGSTDEVLRSQVVRERYLGEETA